MKKICSKCGIEKSLSEFHKDKIFKDGHRSECKVCVQDYQKRYHKNNRKRILKRAEEYRENNPDKIKINNRNHRENNPENIKIWREKNKEKMKSYSKKYREDNKKELNKKRKIYRRNNKEKINENRNKKYNSDPQFNIKRKTRRRIYMILKAYEITKSNKTIELLGCDFIFYKDYLISLFTKGMTWGKLRAGKIHIDHIIPCASFDLTDPEEQKKCFRYSNTQPLWAEDNLKKGCKLECA